MQHEKEQVALTSIAASAALTIAKGLVGFATGSLAILSEAGHSLIDLGATVMTYAAVRISGKPADAEHQYGHGKVESVSALAETALLFLLSGVVIWEAIKRLTEHEEHMVIANAWAFGVIAVSIAVDFFRSRALAHTAKETQSQALEADALHFSSDLWASLAVLIGLGGVRVRPVVGGFGRRAGGRDPGLRRRLAARPPHHRHAHRHGAGRRRRKDHGRRRESARRGARRAGARARGRRENLHRSRRRGQPHHAARPRERAQGCGRRRHPPATCRAPSRPSPPIRWRSTTRPCIDRVMVIARNRALAVHHVTVHDLNDRLAISLDLEVDGKLSLREAHALADGLESAIAAELGASVEIDTHIEPLQPHRASGREAPPERVKAVEIALAELAADGRTIARRARCARARDRRGRDRQFPLPASIRH